MPARASRATLALAVLALTLTGCYPNTGSTADPAAPADPTAPADPAAAAEPAPAADTTDPEEAEILIVEAFIDWGYPASEELKTMADMTASSLQPGCANPSDYLDGFVPSYVNSFNTSNGELPDLTVVEVRPVLDRAIEILCS